MKEEKKCNKKCQYWCNGQCFKDQKDVKIVVEGQRCKQERREE